MLIELINIWLKLLTGLLALVMTIVNIHKGETQNATFWLCLMIYLEVVSND